MSKTFSVYLSGGGVKGAYQYGFFKRVHAACPEFRIEKLCCSSVGSLNALPIMTRRTEHLARYWEEEKGRATPFDKILVPWRPAQVCEAIRAQTVYAGMDTARIEAFWDQCDERERALLENVTILSYNRLTGEPVSERCVDKAAAVRAIESTCCFPGLYPPRRERPHVIDGYLIKNVLPHLPASEAPWLCLDLTHARVLANEQCEIRNVREARDAREGRGCIQVFAPTNRLPGVLACVSSVDVRPSSVRELVRQGEADADLFLSAT
jgi:hypothetical protein